MGFGCAREVRPGRGFGRIGAELDDITAIRGYRGRRDEVDEPLPGLRRVTPIGKLAEVSLPGLRRGEALGPRPGLPRHASRRARHGPRRNADPRGSGEVGLVCGERVLAPRPLPSGLLAGCTPAMKPARIHGTTIIRRMLPAIVAHRGDAEHFPENTLPALEAAWRRGITTSSSTCRSPRTACLTSSTTRPSSAHALRGDVRLMMSGQLDGIDAGEPARFGCTHAGTALPRLSAVAELMAGLPDARAFVEVKRASLVHHGRAHCIERVLASIAPVLGPLHRNFVRRRRRSPRADSRARPDRLGPGRRPGAASARARSHESRVRVLRLPAVAGRACAACRRLDLVILRG